MGKDSGYVFSRARKSSLSSHHIGKDSGYLSVPFTPWDNSAVACFGTLSCFLSINFGTIIPPRHFTWLTGVVPKC